MRNPGKLVALVVLPQQYNPKADGHRRRIEEGKFTKSMKEIAARFGGGVLWRFGSDAPRGFWWDRGVLYEDEIAVVEVDIWNNEASKEQLIEYARDILCKRFRQKAIYVKFLGPIDVEVVNVSLE